MIFVITYWSIILLLGIFFTFKTFEGVYDFVLSILRKSLITRFLFVLPIRLVMNITLSLFKGILILFHAIFFAVIIVIIFVVFGYRDTDHTLSQLLAYGCIAAMFLPVIYKLFTTIIEEIEDLKQSKND
jgi:hypothetical protein